MKYSCFMYSEGGRDKKFLHYLIDLDKFKYHTKQWSIITDSASGVSPEIILTQCKKISSNRGFDLIICFIDLDVLKIEYPKNWLKEKIKLEESYPGIEIIWFLDNAEDEFRKVLGELSYGKHKLNAYAIKEAKKFINSDLWTRILSSIRLKERELDDNSKVD